MAQKPDRDRFIIVDAHHLAYRMHFALPPMHTKDGQPTNVLFGFLRKLVQLNQEFRDHRMIAVFDTPQKSFRTAVLADYKGNRPSMPLDLRHQIDIIQEGCQCLGVHTVARPGFEADDVIASLVASALKANAERVVIMTSDKDLLQLVSADRATTSVEVWNDQKQVTMDYAAVVSKMGVPPMLVPDLLALTGDSSDNVPGIPGIGQKTAVKLLNEYDSLEAILDAAPNMKESKRKNALLEFKEQSLQAKQLIQLLDDVELEDEELQKSQSQLMRCDSQQLSDFLDRFELKKLKKALQ